MTVLRLSLIIRATKDASLITDLNILYIINKPTATTIPTEGERNILIFDLGNSIFDISLLTIKEGIFEVKATASNTYLSDKDFDNRLINYFDLFRGTIKLVKRVLRDAKIDKAFIYEIVFIGSSTYIPKIQKLISDLFNKDANKSINPDKAVAYSTIKVTYDLNTNNIINISAIKKGIGKTYKITISNNKGYLSKEEIEYILSKAKKYKEEDKAKASYI
ncbi:uncharacterized protein N7477_006237 [Penicillium maclennaniae]|uniref:uncharacterized protein n=1 Tax=Penicillium maclennaniae TaxID=1343394 RepID=UPI0025408EA5|nr:uncharacterized protein N7477_006237 [Penicillium maclennaniae]KAJ5667667.1 hypothetical protein N7477_006237 [Penicillium maclennaniae]